MSAVSSVCAAAVITAVIALMIKKYNAEIAVVLSICACVGILLWAIISAAPVISQINGIAERTGIENEWLGIVFKAVGICFITEFAYDCCKDSGQNALAGNTLLAGKISVLITVLPLFEKILEISLELVGI